MPYVIPEHLQFVFIFTAFPVSLVILVWLWYLIKNGVCRNLPVIIIYLGLGYITLITMLRAIGYI